jgi:hypothetical protein
LRNEHTNPVDVVTIVVFVAVVNQPCHVHGQRPDTTITKLTTAALREYYNQPSSRRRVAAS